MTETKNTKEEKFDEKNEKELTEKAEENIDENKKEVKKPELKKIEKKQKSKITLNAYNLKISTKQSAALCRFIKNKNPKKAISYLESVVKLKKPVPMKGELPHRHGKFMSGRFPKKAAENFIKLLKNARATSIQEGIENPIIIEAIANIGSRPYGRFGSIRRKRTHLKITIENKKSLKT